MAMMYWDKIKCKMCEEAIEAKEKGLKGLEVMHFVAKHIASCYDFFEVTRKFYLDDGEN